MADDWDATDVGDLLANVKVTGNFDEEEDLIEKEKREEQERLREAGIRHKKLEEERRIEEIRGQSAAATASSSFAVGI